MIAGVSEKKHTVRAFIDSASLNILLELAQLV
jgi:hypothetical protein